MNVGDLIEITELKTGRVWREMITSGMPSAGLYCSESGIPFWASGIHWTPDIKGQHHQSQPKEYSCIVVENNV